MTAPPSRFSSNRDLFLEWLRFLAVGGMNTAVGYGLYALCFWFWGNYVAATAVSMVGGVLFNYRTTGALVFAKRDGSFLRFIGCYVVMLALNVVLLKLLDDRGVNPYLAGLIVAVPAAVLSFVLLRTFVFRASRKT